MALRKALHYHVADTLRLESLSNALTSRKAGDLALLLSARNGKYGCGSGSHQNGSPVFTVEFNRPFHHLEPGEPTG